MTDQARKKRPRDPNQRAKQVVDIATGETEEEESEHANVRSAAGKTGGKARAKKLTAKERSEIARLAAQARWKKSD